MSITVTGASGQLGRLVVEALLGRGVAAADIVATARSVEAIKDLAERGVVVRPADFGDPASLREAFAGGDKLLLVSTTFPSERQANHRRAIDAALEAGVSLIAYTSQLHADSATTILGKGHGETEQYLRERNAPAVFLRNGWYLENYTAQLPIYLENHVIVGAGGAGRVSAASRADLAEAAAAVLTTEGHVGAVYELGGDSSFTLPELAAEVSSVTGEQVSYKDLSVAELTEILRGAGLPGEIVDAVADADRGLAAGELYTDSDDLRRLIGRPTTTLSDAIAAAR